MEQIVLVGFLPDGNGRSCDLHPYGCGNSLVLNRDDYGVGMVLWLLMFVINELACYTIRDEGSDGCRVCFTSREFAARENGHRLDGAIVHIAQMFTPESENRSMRRLYYHNRGYAYATILSLSS
jgi:hypothetical protein